MPLNIDWQQILLHLFNFVLLFTILFVLLYRPIKKFMEKRSNYYKEMDEKSKKTLEESVAAKDKYEEHLKNAEVEINNLREKASKEADELSESIIADAKVEATKIVENAKVEAAKERRLAVSEANEEISKMVADATKKIVFEDTNSAYETFLNTVEGSENNDK